METCPGPLTSFSTQVTVITETRTRTSVETIVARANRRWQAVADEGNKGQPAPTQPAAFLADKREGRLLLRQEPPLTDPPIPDPLPTDGTSISLPTPGPSVSDTPGTSETGSATPPPSPSPPTSSSTSSISSTPSSSSRTGSTTAIVTQVITEVIQRTETIQVPLATITPPCPTTIPSAVLPTSLSVPLSTYISGSSSGLLSSVVVTTVVTSGGSLSTVVTAVPTLISFGSKQATSQLQPGIVVAIVVGSLAALSSMVLFACIFSRRRKKQQRAREMTERVTIGRMLESEGFEEGIESPYPVDRQLPAPSYTSYEYGIVGSPTRQATLRSLESKTASSSHVPIYGHDSSGGVEMTSDFNMAANKRAIAARASGSSSGSIFRENFDANKEDELGPSRSMRRSSPTPFSSHGGHGGSVHEPLIRGTHDRFPSTSSGGSAQPSGLFGRASAAHSAHSKGYGPPPISYTFSSQAHLQYDPHRAASHPPISYPLKQNWSSSSLPPGAVLPSAPHWNSDAAQPPRFAPQSPQEVTSAVHSSATHTTEPYFFLPDASDSYLLPRLSTDVPSLLEDSELSRHVTDGDYPSPPTMHVDSTSPPNHPSAI